MNKGPFGLHLLINAYSLAYKSAGGDYTYIIFEYPSGSFKFKIYGKYLFDELNNSEHIIIRNAKL